MPPTTLVIERLACLITQLMRFRFDFRQAQHLVHVMSADVCISANICVLNIFSRDVSDTDTYVDILSILGSMIHTYIHKRYLFTDTLLL